MRSTHTHRLRVPWALLACCMFCWPQAGLAATPRLGRPLGEDVRPGDPRPDLVTVSCQQRKPEVTFVRKGDDAWTAALQADHVEAAVRDAYGRAIVAFDPPFAVDVVVRAWRAIVRTHDITVELEVTVRDARDLSKQFVGRGESAIKLETIYDQGQLQGAMQLALTDAARDTARRFQNRAGEPPPVNEGHHRWWLGMHYAGLAPIGLSAIWQPTRTWLAQWSINPVWPRASTALSAGWRIHWDDHMALWLHGAATIELPWALVATCKTMVHCSDTTLVYGALRAEVVGHLGERDQHRFAVEVQAQAGYSRIPGAAWQGLVRPYGGVSYHFGF